MGLVFSLFDSAPVEKSTPGEICFEPVADEELADRIVDIVNPLRIEDDEDVIVGSLRKRDFFKKLDERIPVDSDLPSVWRMSMDHPVVYILTNLKGIQPIHIIEDKYGDMVVYKNEHVQNAVSEMIDLYKVYKSEPTKEK